MAAANGLAIANPTTYAQRFLALPDKLNGDYAQFMDSYGPEGDHSPATLRDQAIMAGQDVPKVFVYLDGTGIKPVIRNLHRPTRYAPSLGVTTPWDGDVFAFLGDVGPGNAITMVKWPANAFVRTNQSRVPVLGAFAAEVAALTGHGQIGPPRHCIGPYTEEDATTELVRTRRMIPVPPAYAALVINRVFSPAAFWTQVIGQVFADQRQLACNTLVNWARVACTHTPPMLDGTPGPPVVAMLDPLVAPLADGELQVRSWEWLVSDLPGLYRMGGGMEAALDQHLVALTAEFAQQRAERAQSRAAERAPKSVTERFPHASDSMRMLCEVGSDAELPLFWRQLAATKHTKQEGMYLLTQSLEARGREYGGGGQSAVPIVSPELYERVSHFHFSAGADSDNLTAGLSPFLVVTQASPNAAATRERATVFELSYGGHAAPSLDQYNTLIATAPQMPGTMLELLLVYRGYSLLLDVLLGEHHRMAETFQNFVGDWEQLQVELDLFLGANAAQLAPLFVRHTQLLMMGYFSIAERSGPRAILPDLAEAVSFVKYRRLSSLPPIPARYVVKKAGPSAGANTVWPGGAEVKPPPNAATTGDASDKLAPGSPTPEALRSPAGPIARPHFGNCTRKPPQSG
jgi:hypothetical protein